MCAEGKAATATRQADKQNCDLKYYNQTQNNHTIVHRAPVDTPGKDTKHPKQPQENSALIRIQSQSAQTHEIQINMHKSFEALESPA